MLERVKKLLPTIRQLEDQFQRQDVDIGADITDLMLTREEEQTLNSAIFVCATLEYYHSHIHFQILQELANFGDRLQRSATLLADVPHIVCLLQQALTEMARRENRYALLNSL